MISDEEKKREEGKKERRETKEGEKKREGVRKGGRKEVSASLGIFFNLENKSAILKELFHLTLMMCFGLNYIFKCYFSTPNCK